MPATQSLVQRQHLLSDPSRQLELLNLGGLSLAFDRALEECEDVSLPLRASGVQILQINVGKVCNQACRHCHVDAGPDRRESMSRETMQACLDALERGRVPILDITGGAPEMNPSFRWLVAEARTRGAHVIDRCNLTILLAPGFDDLPRFLADHQVEIVASLPCYLAENTDRQRGDGVFDRSIEALRLLNDLGYGRPESGLLLNLVYNPIGPVLPPGQPALEAAYHRELRARHGVEFNHLYTITNMPISRFLEDLVASGGHELYMQTLVEAFNPQAVAGLMCRTTLSVGWDGRLFDCDFNQMLGLPLAPGQPAHIRDFDPERLSRRPITTAPHCFGCTAGAGSSCQGAIAPSGKSSTS
ncbi:MAG: arsenosugar biosynthesis radical SAM protein ArsS [Isosphaeraceae bacterium]